MRHRKTRDSTRKWGEFLNFNTYYFMKNYELPTGAVETFESTIFRVIIYSPDMHREFLVRSFVEAKELLIKHFG